eukprot:12887628-Heterocapsa_arctica.AAC.1
MADHRWHGLSKAPRRSGRSTRELCVVGPVVGAEALVVRAVVCGVQRQVHDGQAGPVVATDLVEIAED